MDMNILVMSNRLFRQELECDLRDERHYASFMVYREVSVRASLSKRGIKLLVDNINLISKLD